MNKLETDIIKFYCGEHYEKCTNIFTQSCYICEKRANCIKPLAEYLTNKGYINSTDLVNYCNTLKSELIEGKTECEASIDKMLKSTDLVSIYNVHHDWHSYADKLETVEVVVKQISQLLKNEQ